MLRVFVVFDIKLVFFRFISGDIITCAEPIVRNGKELIVDETLEHGEEAHHEPEVPCHKEACHGGLLDLSLESAQNETQREKDHTMSAITVHDSEEVGEGDYLEDSGVDFTVSGELVGVARNLMEF